MTELFHNRILKSSSEVPQKTVGNYVFRTQQELIEQEKVSRPFVPPLYKKEGEGPEKKEDPLLNEKEEEQERLQEQAREILRQAKEESEKILSQAEKQKEEILNGVQSQAEQIRQEAKTQGYQAGYQEGSRKAKEEQELFIKGKQEDLGNELEKALDSIEEAKRHCLERYLEELKDCAVAVAEKVIHVSLQSSGDVIRQMIVAATEKLDKTAWVKIYMDRPDYERMIQADANVLNELSYLSDNIKFVVMDREEEGSCIIERPDEVLDISVNTQMENIKDILANI